LSSSGQPFTTKDMDNDKKSDLNCAHMALGETYNMIHIVMELASNLHKHFTLFVIRNI